MMAIADANVFAPARSRLTRLDQKPQRAVSSLFGLRANWYALLNAPPGHLRPLDAWRTLAMFWIILEHCLLVFATITDRDSLRKISGFSSFRVFYHASFGVDVFFVLSGFLIGGILIREIDRSGGVNWKRFYLRRMLRMLPIYYFVLSLMALFASFKLVPLDNARFAWANFLQINNFIAYRDQFMRWTWSLAVEEQFYFICPPLLLLIYRNKKFFLPSIAVLIGALIAVHALILLKSDMPLHWGIFNQTALGDRAQYIDAIYNKPYIRFTSLFIGMLGAYYYESGLVQRIFSHRLEASLLIATAGLILFSVLSYIEYAAGHETTNLLFELIYREAFSFSILIMILASIFIFPLKQIMSLRIFYPLFQLSYGAYLIYLPIALVIRDKFLGASMPLEFFTFWHIFLSGALLFAIGLTFTLPLYLFVERPFINLRARIL